MSDSVAQIAPVVGKEVLAYCTSCKMDLAHTVASLKGDKIAKCECKTCKKTHVYRSPKGVTEPPKKKAKKKRASKRAETIAEEAAKTIEAEWSRLMAAHESAPMIPYKMTTTFKLGDKLSHPKFGDGIVGKLLFPNKLEVIFKQDIKILIHEGPKSA